MRILLIYPPFATNWPLALGFGEPLGIAYIAAAVEQSGRHQVALLDCVGTARELHRTQADEWHWIGLTHDEVLAAMREHTFDVIGVSVSKTSSVDTGVETLIERIKQAYPGTPIIAGGPEVSHYWMRYITLPAIDYIVVGEGEQTIVDLLDALEGCRSIDTVKGIVRQGADGKAIKAEDAPIVDIDTIPWPARHLLPMQTYIARRPTTELPAATILTSRACPFRCAFCSTIQIWGNRWRGRSAVDVVDEIAFLVHTYGVREVRVQDDNFCVKRSRVHQICDMLIERELDIRLHIDPGVMAHLADKDLLSALRRAGLIHLNMQLESGAQKTQAYIDKKIDLGHVRAMLDWAHHLGMRVSTNVILGFPDETLDDMRESVLNAIALPYDEIHFNLLDPKRGTRVWRDFVELGIVDATDMEVELPVRTTHCSAEDVGRMRDWAIEEFLRSRQLESRGDERIVPIQSIRHERGHCYYVALPEADHLADTADFPLRSPLELYEDAIPFAKPHSQHEDIRQLGRGSYSHWGHQLYFSASDNSDPRSNGRIYRVRF